MVDLEVHPKNVRSRTAKMGRKEATEFRKAHAEALKKLADPASTTLQNLVQECLAHSSYYQKATDRCGFNPIRLSTVEGVACGPASVRRAFPLLT